jgi:hypothetical protein
MHFAGTANAIKGSMHDWLMERASLRSADVLIGGSLSLLDFRKINCVSLYQNKARLPFPDFVGNAGENS